ncbi:hypothetical protein KC354_g13464 [Hortaea werneckii]|nr:hypothetical protein KC354_g13464 [Hortaea werneckii]
MDDNSDVPRLFTTGAHSQALKSTTVVLPPARLCEDKSGRQRSSPSYGCSSIEQQRLLPSPFVDEGISQREREDAIRSFRTPKAPILVATGVSTRSWDVAMAGVKCVINFDLPSTTYGGIDEYIHRVGLTARIGYHGLATSFYNDRNEELAQDLVKVLLECGFPISLPISFLRMVRSNCYYKASTTRCRSSPSSSVDKTNVTGEERALYLRDRGNNYVAASTPRKSKQERFCDLPRGSSTPRVVPKASSSSGGSRASRSAFVTFLAGLQHSVLCPRRAAAAAVEQASAFVTFLAGLQHPVLCRKRAAAAAVEQASVVV